MLTISGGKGQISHLKLSSTLRKDIWKDDTLSLQIGKVLVHISG